MFVDNMSCLNLPYLRGEAYLAARQGGAAAGEFQKILDHSGIVWNCWTGVLAHLGMGRANALQASALQAPMPTPPALGCAQPTKISSHSGKGSTAIYQEGKQQQRNSSAN